MELLSLPPVQLAEALGGPGRARRVFSVLRSGGDPFTVLEGRARARLEKSLTRTQTRRVAITESEDGVHKLGLALADDARIETVLIPSSRRTTLCISTQAGCAKACSFCLTGRMGLVRQLSAGEIVAQVVQGIAHAKAACLPSVRNLVFMGMGEPLDNPRAVRDALEVLTAPGGLGFGCRHITVSTVGPTTKAVEGTIGWPCQLAWSLHSASDELRRSLIPTARTPVRRLKDAFIDVCQRAKTPLFVEVTLMDGVNDGAEDAEGLAALFEGTEVEVRFNLLPLNEVLGVLPQRRSPTEQVERFRSLLMARGYFCSVRVSRGSSHRAACGQLAVLPT